MRVQITPVPAGAALPLAAMHRPCFPEDPWDEAALDRVFALSGVFGYLVWQDDAPIGFVLARDLRGEIEILSLAVLPDARRRGHGRALLDAVAAEARRRGSFSLVLEVAADNEAARGLYAGAGFRPVGRRPRYYRRRDGAADGLILRRGITGELPPA